MSLCVCVGSGGGGGGGVGGGGWGCSCKIYIQSTLVISQSKGLSEILRDICTSTYQICRIEEKQIEQTHFTNYYVT